MMGLFGENIREILYDISAGNDFKFSVRFFTIREIKAQLGTHKCVSCQKRHFCTAKETIIRGSR